MKNFCAKHFMILNQQVNELRWDQKVYVHHVLNGKWSGLNNNEQQSCQEIEYLEKITSDFETTDKNQ